MRHLLMVLFIVAPLSGCGVFLPYLYDAGALDDRLAVSMSRTNVVKHLGKPYAVVQKTEQRVIWEYRFYAKREWLGYLIHCPFDPYCYIPGEAPEPYYVAFWNDQLCLWGSPFVVMSLVRKVCPSESTIGRPSFGNGPQVSAVPVFMPPRVVPLPVRLAILPMSGNADNRLASWLDFTLNFLRSRHPSLVFVEREDLQVIFDEMLDQYSGRVSEETAVRVGRLTGADSLLLYRLNTPDTNWDVSASFELRMVSMETGTTLFRQIVTATASIPPRSGNTKEGNSSAKTLARQLAVQQAAAYALASLAAAFGDNPLGIVPDHSWTDGGVKLIGLLEGGLAARAGLKPGDRIVAADGVSFGYWAEDIAVPTALTVERDRAMLDLHVASQPELLKKEVRD